jgi:quercetin dioxygenase-like cupin family protein
MLSVIRNPSRAKILELENEMSKHEQVKLDPVHYLAGGVYARELLIPKGVVVTGKVHKGDHLFFVMSGDLEVMTDDGVKRIKAPAILSSKAGIKRVAYAYEDTICVAVHATDKTEIKDIEDELVEPVSPLTRVTHTKNIEGKL